MKKYVASTIIATVIVSASLISCTKEVAAPVSKNTVTHLPAVSTTAMAPKTILWPDTVSTKQGH